MFTGLIEAIGTVSRLEARPLGRWLEIDAPQLDDLALGDSVAINGCCLTVVGLGGGRFAVEAVAETLARTTIGGLKHDAAVNLERALRVGDRLGGHMVQGHVDAVGVVRHIAAEGAGRRIRFALPEALLPFVAEKGSIAVDGISLTITGCELNTFEVALIPHTLEHTTARDYRLGTRVNLEVDLLARYIARMVEAGRLERSGIRPAERSDIGRTERSDIGRTERSELARLEPGEPAVPEWIDLGVGLGERGGETGRPDGSAP